MTTTKKHFHEFVIKQYEIISEALKGAIPSAVLLFCQVLYFKRIFSCEMIPISVLWKVLLLFLNVQASNSTTVTTLMKGMPEVERNAS